MTAKSVLQVIALAWAALFFVVPAHAKTSADTTNVTPEFVCRVKDAIRFRSPAWPDWYCLRVTHAVERAATTTGQRPDVLMSIAVVESDLRSGVEHWYSVDGFPRPGACGDLGIMGIRCCLDDDWLCGNGLVKGWKYPAVMRLENNIMLGAKILAAKPKLNDYNGGKGYAEKVYAVAGALAGVRVKIGPGKGAKRIRKLVDQILHALGFERTT
jgi:hypothetical protein